MLLLRCRSRTSRSLPARQGQPPADKHQDFQIAVNVSGRLTDPEQFGNIILKQTPSGLVRVSDVGRAQVGAENYGTDLNFSGYPAVGVGVQQLSNANALEVDRKAKAVLYELSKSFPPGLHAVVALIPPPSSAIRSAR